MRDDSVFKAASGLHGGIGGMGDVCGSLLGSSLMLGLICGCSLEEIGKPEEKDDATQLVSQLYKWFKKEFSSVKCRIIRAKFQREIDKETNVQQLTKQDKMDRQHAKCDELNGKTAAWTAATLWDVLERRKIER